MLKDWIDIWDNPIIRFCALLPSTAPVRKLLFRWVQKNSFFHNLFPLSWIQWFGVSTVWPVENFIMRPVIKNCSKLFNLYLSYRAYRYHSVHYVKWFAFCHTSIRKEDIIHKIFHPRFFLGPGKEFGGRSFPWQHLGELKSWAQLGEGCPVGQSMEKHSITSRVSPSRVSLL